VIGVEVWVVCWVSKTTFLLPTTLVSLSLFV
jgi:hypothetical protein